MSLRIEAFAAEDKEDLCAIDPSRKACIKSLKAGNIPFESDLRAL